MSKSFIKKLLGISILFMLAGCENNKTSNEFTKDIIAENKSVTATDKTKENEFTLDNVESEKDAEQEFPNNVEDIDEAIKNYYVHDLPQSDLEEDYLIGNWKGSVSDKWDDGNYRDAEYEFFINKNADDTYKVISRMVVKNSNMKNQPAGSSKINELKGYYDKDTHYFTTEFVKTLGTTKGFKSYGYTPDKFLLNDGILYWLEGIENGIVKGKLKKF